MIATYTAKSASVNMAGPDTVPPGRMLRVVDLEAHAGTARADLLDDERAAAGVNLRKAGIYQRFDALRIEQMCYGSVT